MLTWLYRLQWKINHMMATRKKIRRCRREVQGWRRMQLACHEWAEKIDHADSRRALLSLAENYRNAIDAHTRDDPSRGSRA